MVVFEKFTIFFVHLGSGRRFDKDRKQAYNRCMSENRSFTAADQQAFASLSGDYNPLHVDPEAARRLLWGACAVHGIHQLLWGLDAWLAATHDDRYIAALDATFHAPLLVGETAQVRIEPAADHIAITVATHAGTPLTTLRLKLHARGAPAVPALADQTYAPNRPCEPSADEIASAAGEVAMTVDRRLIAARFQALAASGNLVQVAALLASTRVVGMLCPGLHSIFSELHLTFAPAAPATGNLQYHTSSLHRRFGLVTLTLAGGSVSGTLKAFIRPAPFQQATAHSLAAMVAPDAFAAQDALVIGGTRGLGEAVVKLLALGGAKVSFTYHSGAADARRITDDLAACGSQVTAFPFDVLAPVKPAIAPSHLYYFATPPIATSARRELDPVRLQRFLAYYVHGLQRTMGLFIPGLRGLYCPSTVFIDSPPDNLWDYALAKASGEEFCRMLGRAHPDLVVYCPRLPRLASDQTQSVLPLQRDETAPIMLASLKAFHAL
jgi:acyl dehydratase